MELTFYSCLFGVLFTWILYFTFFLLDEICNRFWSPCRCSSIFSKMPPEFTPVVKKLMHRRIAERQQTNTQWRKGIKQQVFAQLQEGIHEDTLRSSVRQLLCDDADCKVCGHAAQEALAFIYSWETKQEGLKDSKSQEPVSCIKYSAPPCGFLVRGPKSHLRSASEPAPLFNHILHDQKTPALSSSRLLSKDGEARTIPTPHHVPYAWKEDSDLSIDEDSLKEDSFRSISFTYSTSSSWSNSSLSFSELSSSSLKVHVSTKQVKKYHSKVHHKSYKDSSQISSGKAITGRQHKKKSGRKTPSGLSETSKTDSARFRGMPISFIDKTMLASLESHIVIKRMQHLIGMPLAFLRSLKKFIPSVPYSPTQKPKRKVIFAPRPRILSFVATGIRKELERHLKKMIQQKRWQLPQRVQDALKHIKSYSPSRPETFPSAGWRHKHKDIGQIKSARRTGKPITKQSATLEVLSSKTTPAVQEKLQVHITKKSLEMRLETFHSIVQLSQKISTAKARSWLLPKLIPLGQVHHQPRNKLGLSLRKKADAVEMNVKSKCIYFLWGLPTLYMKSLRKFVPSPPSQPISFTVGHSFIEFGLATPTLMIPSDGKNLETHVLKKRLQHQWGLPRLVLGSLRQFLLPTPPSQVHLRTKPYDPYEVQIFIDFTQLFFTTSEVKQKLETHLKSKIIERQWGLPKRVFESLQVFVPPASMLTRRPKVDGKSFAREFKMGRPSTAMVSYRRKSSLSLEKHQLAQRSKGQVLQRKLPKKVLESHLSPVVSTAHQPWRGTSQRVVHKLPHIIPPRTSSLQLRSQQLLFVDQEAVSHIKLNIIHKDLAYKWKMPTIFSKSLNLLFQNIRPSVFVHHPSRKSVGFSFTEKETPFIEPKAREALEWHVRKKTLHHIWGLPGLMWRFVQYLLPATPSAHPQKKSHKEVIIFPSEVTFLSNTVKRELERNVQKQVVCQRWLLPKRVLESMKLFYSSSSYLKPIIPWQEQGSRLSKIEIAAPPQIHARIQVEVQLQLQLHVSKKHLEMYLEALPVMVRTSWRQMVFSLKTPLPKIISSHQPLLPRRTLLPFACRKAMDRIEMTVQRNHFASLWQLPTHYVKALEQLMPKPLSQPLRSQKTISFQFTKIQWMLPPGFSVETLEHHVNRKRIQHEWGFPVLIEKSLKSFIRQPPSRSSLTKTKTSVYNLAQELLFLPQDICKNLELHVQKTKLYRQWGLPQRVLGSLKKLQPEGKIYAPRPKTLVRQTRRTIPTYKTVPLFQTKTILCTMCCKQRMVAIPPHFPHKLSFKGSNNLEKISLHLSKKYVEIHLEVFPDVVMSSWKLNVLVRRQPLPKLISHSPKTLQPRRSFLPFMQKHEAKRLEMVVQICYFSSLCDSGKRYVEDVEAMIPRSYASPVQRKKIPVEMFSETRIAFLQQQERELIELHIRKKRLHHEWGFPALIQSSLRVFMQGFPPCSTTHRTTINVHALPQKLSFLPWPTCNYLEFHLQKLKLQRRWGLPKRILESLKYFRPSAPLGKAQLPQSDKKTKLMEARVSAGGSQRACCKSIDSTHYAPKKLDLLKGHIRRKYLQIELETLPQLVTQSQRESGIMPQMHLPKLIEAGQKSPTNRALSLLFLPPSDINMLEQNLRHKHLLFLSGISKKYTESLSIVVPVRPFPARTQKASIAIQQLKTPFVQKEAREMLEYHIQRKRMHHFWGLPSLIQSSLQAFMTYFSIDPRPPPRIRQDIRISVQDLPFVSEHVQKNLASSIKKMVIHSQWGLPKRLQKFLRGFRPTPPGELREFRNFLVSGPKFKRAQRITGLPEASVVDGQHKKASLLTGESAGLLERHIQHKKFQHEWGLPSVLQRSLRAFAPLPPEPQRASTKLAIAGSSSLPTEGRLTTTPKLLFLDPVMKEHLEAHTKRQITRHKWGLPKQVQESMRALLPPTYFRQPEDLTDRIPLGTHDQVYPARIKEISDTRDRHLPTIRKARKRRSQIEEYGDRQLPLGHPKSPSPRVKSRTPTLSGKVTPKFHQESWVATFYTKEVWDALEFHIRHKKIQHDWGLPLMVKKSLNAFAPHPPELQSTTTRSGGRISVKSQGKGATHRSVTMVQATIPRPDLHFLSTEVNDRLEAHLKNWTVQHKWGLPKRIWGSLRAIATPRFESQAGMHQPHRQQSRSAQQHKIFSHHEREASQWQSTSKKGASEISNAISHQGQSSAWARLLFLTEDNWNFLEFHIQQKKIQHDWGVPSTVLQSLNAFFPFPIKIQSPGKKRSRANQWVTGEIKVFVPSTFFLDRETKEVLEAHMKKKIAEHKWSVPKRIQQTVRTLSAPRAHFQYEDFYQEAPFCHQCKLLLQSTDDSQTEKEEEDGDLLEGSEKDRRRKGRKKEYLQPRNQRRSTTSGRVNKQHLLFSELSLPFLSDEDRNYLEFHILQKKIQRAWSLPFMVLKSLHAFAPFSPEIPQSARKRKVKTHVWIRKEVVVIVPDLSFLSKRTKDILEDHLKRRTAEHRWSLPKTIQKLLRQLVPSRPPSQHETIHEQPSLCWRCKSLLESTDVSQTEEEEDEDFLKESKKVRRRKRRRKQHSQARNQRRSPSSGRASRPSLFSELRLPFLSDEARNYLEFHILQKKIQRAWSLPSTVLKSLHAFSPFSPEIERHIQSTRKRIVETYGWSRKEVVVIVPDLSFLSKRTKDILEDHLKRRTAEHRWGMPKTIQKILGSFVPSRPPSQHETIHEQPSLCWKCKSLLESTDFSETEEEDEDLLKESKEVRRRKRRTEQYSQARNQRRSTSSGRASRQFLFSELRLPFLSDEARNYLEFHIQQKKLQHAWGLPFMVLKSLDAFAPYLHDSTKHPLAIEGAGKLPQDREFHMIAQNLSFLSSDTKQYLEVHLRNLIAVHRWGLPKHAQTTLRAFLHPGTLNSPAQSHVYKSPQISLPQTWLTDRSPMKKFQLRKKEAKLQVPITSSKVCFGSRKVDFLDDGAQNLLEFHILHKKIQHAWGLPAIIQKSLWLFAPSESQKRPQSAGDVTMKTAVSAAAKKAWVVKEIRVAPQQLHFLHPDIKKQLESHIRDVTVKHRWRLPKLVQDTLVAFIPQTEEMREGMKEPFSTNDEDLLKSSSSLGAPDMYDSELFYELHQTPMESRPSWLDTEEPSFCFDKKTQHFQGKMARREASEVSTLQKPPPERTESDLYLKDEQRWASDHLGRTRDPRGPFFSTPVSGYRKRKYHVSSSSESLSMEKYPSQRTRWLARERKALPCSSNLSLKKDLLKQLQSTSQTKEDDRYYPVGLKQSHLSKDSSSSWVPNRFCRIGNCPCLCHLPSSREGSMFSLPSVRKQEQRPDLIWDMVKETETDSSSLLTEDRLSLQSTSAKKAEVWFSPLTSEDAISESSLRNASLPEQETTPSSAGDQGTLFHEGRVVASNTELQNVTTSGNERPNTSGSPEQFPSSPKGIFFQEGVQSPPAVEQTSVLHYRREGEQTVTELGMDERDGGKHSTIEKVEEKTLNWGTDLSRKEPSTDSRSLIEPTKTLEPASIQYTRALIEHKSTKTQEPASIQYTRALIEHKSTKTQEPASIQKRRQPMSEGGQSAKPKKQVRHTQFLLSTEPDEKMSILGRILERKLRLRHGLNLWKHNHGSPQVVSRIKHKIGSFRQSFRVRSRTKSKDSTRRPQSHSPGNTTISSSSGGKQRSRGRSRERRSKTEARRKDLPQKEL